MSFGLLAFGLPTKTTKPKDTMYLCPHTQHLTTISPLRFSPPSGLSIAKQGFIDGLKYWLSGTKSTVM